MKVHWQPSCNIQNQLFLRLQQLHIFTTPLPCIDYEFVTLSYRALLIRFKRIYENHNTLIDFFSKIDIVQNCFKNLASFSSNYKILENFKFIYDKGSNSCDKMSIITL